MLRLFPLWHHKAGFTLLELLVVMSMVGLMTGIVAPRLWQWVEGARERKALDALHSALNTLPVRTFFKGQAMQVTSTRESTLPLLPGWRLEVAPPLFYEANGMTGGGRIKVWSEERLLADWQVLAPSGRVVASAEANPPRGRRW